MAVRFTVVFTVALCLVTHSIAAPPSFLKMIRKRSVDADPQKAYELREIDGPWMILAANFAGEGAKERAHRMVLEVRQKFDLPAFVHHESFDFTGKVSKRAEMAERLRYANQYQFDAYAVLVGEYDSIEHPALNKDLRRIKTAKLSVFTEASDIQAETSLINPVTAVKAMHKKILDFKGEKEKSPLASAFVTRNPLLPEDYFNAPQVDSFVSQLNEGRTHSLLENGGRFTVVVKTFEGQSTLVDGQRESKFVPSLERLDKYAEDTEKMVRELRKNGVEAYQFHDRNRSLVAVGSFDSLGRELPDGGFEYDPAIREVMRKYSAYNQDFAYTVNGNQIAANHVLSIPLDIEPTPIAVPKATKQSLFRSTIGMR